MFLPQTQVKLTNVSVVRLKKGGKRFEIACYKNKVLEWRKGVETDLDNVIQSETIFVNVSRGQQANQEDLQKAFKNADAKAIVLEILAKGELQIGEKERQHQLSTTYRDIATTIAEKCVNPATKRPYPVTLIEKAMADAQVNVQGHRSSKQQALEIIALLQEKNILPIERAQMRIRVVVEGKHSKKIKEKLATMVCQIEEEDFGTTAEWVLVADPGLFRVLADFVGAETRGRGQVEVMAVSATASDNLEPI
ncbi:hypothetical protein CXG81DRAFT_29460 [Caulochytrium protostelioides]|uniref:Shwachman-Bodian-diamond syndrome protein n=1 Tax=Caulochytrium protostelioides TaxID=1555241 RepID=A0A4P9XBA2_9FUNG|nr:hypothetical protein CXG81DRAFT_29460 [Caulochytrium protostelioides]|eukprot:RKP02645.1 hypothetical protein CXG81DRAFT_29460 [Caulochytrium protostelioides]